MSDKLPDLVLIETLVGSTPEVGECLVELVGNGLLLTLEDVGGKTDAQDGNDG